jgi:hypothetical protein
MSRQDELQRQLALEGAAVRLQRLRSEVEELLRAYPQLRSQKVAARLPAAGGAGPRRKRTISAAGKRAMSKGMREYWARRKARESKNERHSG